MPSYDYKCKDCKTVISIIRSFDESDPGYECKTCGSSLIRVYSVGAIKFNGSGFYSKDK
jgi:putative FmdB family regulatory protein